MEELIKQLQSLYIERFLYYSSNLDRLNLGYELRFYGKESRPLEANITDFLQANFTPDGAFKEGVLKVERERLKQIIGNEFNPDVRDDFLTDRDRFLLDLINFQVSYDLQGISQIYTRKIFAPFDHLDTPGKNAAKNDIIAKWGKLIINYCLGTTEKDLKNNFGLNNLEAMFGTAVVSLIREKIGEFFFNELIITEPITLFNIEESGKVDLNKQAFAKWFTMDVKLWQRQMDIWLTIINEKLDFDKLPSPEEVLVLLKSWPDFLKMTELVLDRKLKISPEYYDKAAEFLGKKQAKTDIYKFFRSGLPLPEALATTLRMISPELSPSVKKALELNEASSYVEELVNNLPFFKRVKDLDLSKELGVHVQTQISQLIEAAKDAWRISYKQSLGGAIADCKEIQEKCEQDILTIIIGTDKVLNDEQMGKLENNKITALIKFFIGNRNSEAEEATLKQIEFGNLSIDNKIKFLTEFYKQTDKYKGHEHNQAIKRVGMLEAAKTREEFLKTADLQSSVKVESLIQTYKLNEVHQNRENEQAIRRVVEWEAEKFAAELVDNEPFFRSVTDLNLNEYLYVQESTNGLLPQPETYAALQEQINNLITQAKKDCRGTYLENSPANFMDPSKKEENRQKIQNECKEKIADIIEKSELLLLTTRIQTLIYFYKNNGYKGNEYNEAIKRMAKYKREIEASGILSTMKVDILTELYKLENPKNEGANKEAIRRVAALEAPKYAAALVDRFPFFESVTLLKLDEYLNLQDQKNGLNTEFDTYLDLQKQITKSITEAKEKCVEIYRKDGNESFILLRPTSEEKLVGIQNECKENIEKLIKNSPLSSLTKIAALTHFYQQIKSHKGQEREQVAVIAQPGEKVLDPGRKEAIEVITAHERMKLEQELATKLGDEPFFRQASNLLFDREIPSKTYDKIYKLIKIAESGYKETYLNASNSKDEDNTLARKEIKKVCNKEIIKAIEDSNISMSKKIRVLNQYKKSVAANLDEEEKDHFFIELNIIARMIELEKERIQQKKDNVHTKNRIGPLEITLDTIKKKIKETREACQPSADPNNHVDSIKLKQACKRTIQNTIKTQLLDNSTLDLSWREKFVRKLLNIVVAISFGKYAAPESARSSTNPRFFKTQTQVHENMETIQNTLAKINI
ncbi:hypothetical protein [Legionella gresilensis]|uniref:hypothetical protein n=1 Tax=Legionella gresilensis TaxID=91823 RepID=UPI00104141A8|nr:hypothetical protein [Legionella gresilensis]